MSLTQFIKPTISKSIIFVLLILVLGVPATLQVCAGYDFGRGEFPCGAIRLTMYNPWIPMHVLDAVYDYTYNILSILFPVIIYFLLSMVYYFSRTKLETAVGVTALTILLVTLRVWVSVW